MTMGTAASIESASDADLVDGLVHVLEKKGRENVERLLERAKAKLWEAEHGEKNIDASTLDSDQIDFEKLAADVLLAHNKVRSNPRFLIPHLETMLSNFDGKKLMISPTKALLTSEGAAAVKECIQFLEKQTPIGPLMDKQPEGLKKAAKDHCIDLGHPGGESPRIRALTDHPQEIV